MGGVLRGGPARTPESHDVGQRREMKQMEESRRIVQKKKKKQKKNKGILLPSREVTSEALHHSRSLSHDPPEVRGQVAALLTPAGCQKRGYPPPLP